MTLESNKTKILGTIATTMVIEITTTTILTCLITDGGTDLIRETT